MQLGGRTQRIRAPGCLQRRWALGRGRARRTSIACGLHGDFSKTIENHAQDLASAKEVGDRAGEGQAYGNLGTCHMHLNEYFNAVAYFEAQHPHPSSWQVARPWHQPRGDATFHTSSRVCSWR